MNEIRVRWQMGLHEYAAGNPSDGGVWFPDTPESWRDIEIIVEAGCETYGPGSHWLEQRQA